MKKRGIGLFVTLIIIFLSFSVFSVYGEEFSINEKKYTSVGYIAEEPGSDDDWAYARIEKGFVLDFRKYQKLQMYTRAWQGGWFEQGCDGGDDAYDCHLLSK